MGILYITEYAELMPSPPGHTGQVPMEPPITTRVVTYTTHAEKQARKKQKAKQPEKVDI